MHIREANQHAMKVFKVLLPHCVMVNIAGSVRRMKQEGIKDIEIVCLPKTRAMAAPQSLDLFGSPLPVLKEHSVEFVKAVHSLGTIHSGDPATGRYVALSTEGVKVDLFMPQAHDYYRQLCLRTGSADFSSKVIAVAWKRKGWVGTPDGLRRQSECQYTKVGTKKTWKCISLTPTLPPVWQSEEEFFEWLGVDYVEPRLRY